MIDNAYALVKAGLQPLLVEYVMQGKGASEIVSSLREEHNIEASYDSVRQMLELIGDANRALTVGVGRELASHHRDAILHYQDFWDSYREAYVLPVGDTDSARLRLDQMKFFATEMRKWWENVGRHLGLADVEHVKAPRGQTTNIINVISEASRTGALTAEVFERLLKQQAELEAKGGFP